MIEDIKKACQVMSEGGVILYPTDTVWGIGCDLFLVRITCKNTNFAQ